MQAAKNAAASAKETAANVAASAKAGMDKTRATVTEKAEKVTAHDPMQKGMATERKEKKIHQAEYNKQEALENNAASRQAVAGGGTHNHTAGGGTHGIQNQTTGGGLHNQHNQPTSGYNPDHLTGTHASGYGTGHQHSHNVDALGANTGSDMNMGGADAAYLNDPHMGIHPTQHTNAGGGGRTGSGTGAPGGVGSVYPGNDELGFENPIHNTTAGGGAPGTYR